MSEIHLKQVQRFLVSLGMTNQKMVYPNLKFPKRPNRPFFYTNFVSTVDGKVWVKKGGLPVGRQGYWPIGSKIDYQVLMELRSHADALIHGGNLAREFGEITLKSLTKNSFKRMCRKLGKTEVLPYYIVSNHPKTMPATLGANVIHSGGIGGLANYLNVKGYKNVLVEGGPTLLASFLKENLIDEIFLTIAPKIFGSEKDSTLTLVEGYLFPPKATKKLLLLSYKQIGDELYLRYRLLRKI